LLLLTQSYLRYTIFMIPNSPKEYFEIAYRTGTDLWSHLPFRLREEYVRRNLPPNALILDVGAGRGVFDFRLVSLGYRVLGLEYIQTMVVRGNAEIKERKTDSEKMRFVEGDVRDIPFADAGFDAVIDTGLSQHLEDADIAQSISEIARVLKPGGYFVFTVLSRDTEQFGLWQPRYEQKPIFIKDGLIYHFFSKDDVRTLCEKYFTLIDDGEEIIPFYTDTVVFHTFLLKKK
jgi:SAM-dependent methyltransferase